MKKTTKLSLLFLWCFLIFFLFKQQSGGVGAACVESETKSLCLWFNHFYLFVYALVLISAAVAIYFLQSLWRSLLLSLSAVFSIYTAQSYTAGELSDIRTYGYELFIISFYLWVPAVFIFAVAALLFAENRKNIIKTALVFTVVLTLIFIFSGRGSTEHIIPITGGLLYSFSVDSLWLSNIVKLCVAIALILPVYYTIEFARNWVKEGKFFLKGKADKARVILIFIWISFIPFISVPFGVLLNKYDIKQSKKFIEEIIPLVEKYKKENNEYPKIIADIAKNKPSPRLIDIYEYLTYGTKGGYYFSRPEKYCFVIFNPGKDFGYFSVTSERGWKFFNNKSSLEEEYVSVCDENESTYEGLIASRLGLPDQNDPIAKMGVEIDSVIRPARTPSAAGKLQELIDKAGEKDPSIYGK